MGQLGVRKDSDGVRLGGADRRRQAGAALKIWVAYAGWPCLSAVAVGTLLLSVPFLPFYDYHEWLFQGDVVADLISGSAAEKQVLASLYGIRAVPVPNVAAPLLIGLLNVWLPLRAAGTLFVIGSVLAFSLAFRHFVRVVQQRPTVVEYTGLLWAFGFFLYKGYLSYLFALSLFLLIIARLHKVASNVDRTPNRWTLLSLTVLGTALYFSHLMAWLCALLATAVHALALARRGDRRSAVHLSLTVLPAVVFLGWYTVAERGGAGAVFYNSLGSKAGALVEPFQIFLRLDPFLPPFSIFWANLLVVLAVAFLLLRNLDWKAVPRRADATCPCLWTAALLAVIALLIPMQIFSGLYRPDGRIIFPAVLVALGALPYRAASIHYRAATTALVGLTLVLHHFEYSTVQPAISRIDAMTKASIPAGAPMLYIAVPSQTGCTPSSQPSRGANTLKWLGADVALDTGQERLSFDETSFVHSRFNQVHQPGITVLEGLPATFEYPYPYVEAVGCPQDLAAIEQGLASSYVMVDSVEGARIFRRR